MTKNILRSASIIFATILATAAIALIACAPAAQSQPGEPHEPKFPLLTTTFKPTLTKPTGPAICSTSPQTA